MVVNELSSTIHGMVYNAMKLFMEVNPSLFDECSAQYRDDEDQVQERQRDRDARWDRLKEMAEQRQNGAAEHSSVRAAHNAAPTADSPDPFGHGKLRNFEALRIEDDTTPMRGSGR